MPYIGNRKVQNTTKEKNLITIYFEDIEGKKLKPLKTTQEFYDYVKTEKLEPDAETRFIVKRMEFFICKIMEVFQKENFIQDIIEYVQTKDSEKYQEKQYELQRKVMDCVSSHNIPLDITQNATEKFYLSSYKDILDQVNMFIEDRLNKVLMGVTFTIDQNLLRKIKELFCETEHDTRTFDDIVTK